MTPIKGMRFVRFRTRTQGSWLLASVFILVLHAGLPCGVVADTPDSPEVRMMLDRAMAYLNTGRLTGEADRLGGKCLTGLAAYKDNRRFGQQPEALPELTQKGLEAAFADVGNTRGKTKGVEAYSLVDNYSVGLALILLCEVHPQEHMPAIEAYLGQVLTRQMSHGGWGYLQTTVGDLSQLQYAVLGLWSAKNAGLQMSDKRMADVMNYVIRVQDPTGAWGYQGKARMVAARTLGRQGELDNVPILLHALTDPDPRVVQEASDGLRLISRKFDGFGLKENPSESEVRTVVSGWKAWYKSVRPDAVFFQ